MKAVAGMAASFELGVAPKAEDGSKAADIKRIDGNADAEPGGSGGDKVEVP